MKRTKKISMLLVSNQLNFLIVRRPYCPGCFQDFYELRILADIGITNYEFFVLVRKGYFPINSPCNCGYLNDEGIGAA